MQRNCETMSLGRYFCLMRPGEQEGDQIVQVPLGDHGAEVRRHGREPGQPPLLDVARRDRRFPCRCDRPE